MKREVVLSDGPLPLEAAQSELNLMLELGGRLRTESEMRRVVAAADLEVTRVLPAQGRLRLLEAGPR